MYIYIMYICLFIYRHRGRAARGAGGVRGRLRARGPAG